MTKTRALKKSVETINYKLLNIIVLGRFCVMCSLHTMTCFFIEIKLKSTHDKTPCPVQTRSQKLNNY